MDGQATNKPAIGIDLGTTNSCVAIYRRDRVEVIINGQGNRTTPSCVAFSDADVLVGEAAKNQSHRNPLNTVFGAKRLIGRSYNEVNRGFLPYKVVADEEGNPTMEVEHKGEMKRISPEEISSLVLGSMKSIAETFLETPVEDAVITVPACFNDSQRCATKEAGRMAGLNVMLLMNEPIAAAVAYHLDKADDDHPSDGESCNVLVFDWGGGTLDVSILEMQGHVLKVKATAGDSYLGGEDLDERMVRFAIDEFKRRHKADISGNPKAVSRLRTACEKAKRALSFAKDTLVEVDGFHEGIDFSCRFTRANFEKLNDDLFDRCVAVVRQCLEDARMKESEMEKVVLVGGSSRIPKVQQMFKDVFVDAKQCMSINPDEAIAYGAAVEAARLAGQSGGMVRDLVLQSVTPLSLGVYLLGGVMGVVILRNTPFPTENFQKYCTTFDNQASMRFDVYEGERSMAKDNNFLGSFEIRGLPPAPAGQTVVTVHFAIDNDGILRVWAEHQGSGAREEITIDKKINGPHDVEAIQRSVDDAEAHRVEDENRRKKAEARAQLEALVINLTTTMKTVSAGANMTRKARKVMKAEVERARSWLESNFHAEASEYNYRVRMLQQSWESAINGKQICTIS